MSSAVSAESTVPSSDVHSPLSTSSYEALSASGFTSWADSVDAASSSDDEIVFSISSLSSSGVISQRRARRSPSLSSEDDLVAVPRSPATSDSTSVSSTDVRRTLDELSTAVSSLTLRSAPALATPTATRFNILHAVSAGSQPSQPASTKGKKVRKTKKERAAAAQSSPPNTAQPADSNAANNKSAQKKKVKARRERRKAEKKAQRKAARAASTTPERGLGERPIVDDLSEAGDHPGSAAFAAAYQDAVNFITSFLSNPSAKSGAGHLRLLQALIVELGLCPAALQPSAGALSFPSLPALPHSLRAAKALLKSQAFLNVRDYLAVRGQGLDALRRVMHPSRSSLMREVRSGKRMPREAVKEKGLGVLLVTCF